MTSKHVGEPKDSAIKERTKHVLTLTDVFRDAYQRDDKKVVAAPDAIAAINHLDTVPDQIDGLIARINKVDPLYAATLNVLSSLILNRAGEKVKSQAASYAVQAVNAIFSKESDRIYAPVGDYKNLWNKLLVLGQGKGLGLNEATVMASNVLRILALEGLISGRYSLEEFIRLQVEHVWRGASTPLISDRHVVKLVDIKGPNAATNMARLLVSSIDRANRELEDLKTKLVNESLKASRLTEQLRSIEAENEGFRREVLALSEDLAVAKRDFEISDASAKVDKTDLVDVVERLRNEQLKTLKKLQIGLHDSISAAQSGHMDVVDEYLSALSKELGRKIDDAASS